MCDPLRNDTLEITSVLPYRPIIHSGSSTNIGPQEFMEDEHIMIDDLPSRLDYPDVEWPTPCAFFGVFDGHGGPDASAYIKNKVPGIFFNADFLEKLREIFNTDFLDTLRDDDVLLKEIKDSICKVFLSADLELSVATNVSPPSGTTAITALILGRGLFVANVGDCRAVLSRKGEAIEMSRDHRPIYASEHARVTKSGGYIDGKYLHGVLAVSRSLGDWDIKQRQGSASSLIAEPEIRSILLTEDDEFLIIACDGIWEALSSQQAVSRVRCGLRRLDSPEQCAEDLVMKARRLHTYDNLTVIVVCFSPLDPSKLSPKEQRKFGCFSSFGKCTV